MTNISRKTITKSIISYSIIILLFTVLTYLFPYTGDDWAWGSEIGIKRLINMFRDYNGRYMGNLFVLILTRSNILKTLTMTAILFGIVYFSSSIVNKKLPLLYIALMFLLAIPSSILKQTVVWTSGFSNYVVSIFLH